MMDQLWQSLLDLDVIHLDKDAPLLLDWRGGIEAWMLFCFALVGVVWVAFACRRERTSTSRKLILAGLRCLSLIVVVAMICEPTLVLQKNRVEPAYVALLIDTSESMATHDVDELPQIDHAVKLKSSGDGSGRSSGVELGPQSTRLSLVKASLLDGDSAAIKNILNQNALEIVQFSDTTETLSYVKPVDDISGAVSVIGQLHANGLYTNLSTAISTTLEQAQGRHLAAIVVASDGQSTQRGDLTDVLDQARGRQIPIYALQVGSATPRCDVELRSVRAQETVFVEDMIAVDAKLSFRGFTQPASATIRLLDERTKAVVASREIDVDGKISEMEVELLVKATTPGRKKYRVEVQPVPHEYVVDNNEAELEVRVLDDDLRVLYVDSYPRYEYRFLKNALIRESTVKISVLLIGADERFVQEGSFPIRRFPDTPEELNRFDAVIFGDVDPRAGWLTHAQMNMLLDFVGNEGGGFGLIAGPRHAPLALLGTPLEKLLPVRIDPQFFGRYDTPLSNGFSIKLTPEGLRSRIFRLTSQSESSLAKDRYASSRAFERLPELFWIAKTLGPKPGAAVLAEHPTMVVDAGQAGRAVHMPIVVTGRYGAGTIYFQATDDTWRWRRHTGELLHDTYWVQVARSLMRSDRMSEGRRFVARTDHRVYDYGAPVRVSIVVYDSQLLAGLGESIPLSVVTHDKLSDLSGSGDVVTQMQAHRMSPYSNEYAAEFVPPRPQQYQVVIENEALAPKQLTTTLPFRVTSPDLEQRRPEANHEQLALMATMTGGRVLALNDVAQAMTTIRDRSVLIPDDVIEPLWDSTLALLIFVVLITTEWSLRKMFGLL